MLLFLVCSPEYNLWKVAVVFLLLLTLPWPETFTAHLYAYSSVSLKEVDVVCLEHREQAEGLMLPIVTHCCAALSGTQEGKYNGFHVHVFNMFSSWSPAAVWTTLPFSSSVFYLLFCLSFATNCRFCVCFWSVFYSTYSVCVCVCVGVFMFTFMTSIRYLHEAGLLRPSTPAGCNYRGSFSVRAECLLGNCHKEHQRKYSSFTFNP